jgi:hypothetical protein
MAKKLSKKKRDLEAAEKDSDDEDVPMTPKKEVCVSGWARLARIGATWLTLLF